MLACVVTHKRPAKVGASYVSRDKTPDRPTMKSVRIHGYLIVDHAPEKFRLQVRVDFTISMYKARSMILLM
jgi:hypothetical protein